MKPKNSVTVPADAAVGDVLHEDGSLVGIVIGFQDDGRAVVTLDGFGTVANVPVGELIEKCDCGSLKVYHDNQEDWVCPFCEL